jgi:uncharacterized membrane protein YdjX (TVP38/TMEM64 family)
VTDQEPSKSSFGSRAGAFFKRLGPAGPLALLATVSPGICGFVLFAYMGTVGDWLRSHGTLGVVAYTAAFAVLAGLALLPTWAQAVLGGYAFGLLGLPAALAGFAGGAVIGYELARKLTGDRVMSMLAEKPKWRAVRDALVRDHEQGAGFWKSTGMVALIRVPPNSPFALTNIVLASVQVPRVPMLIGTVIGMLPRTAAAVWIGSHIQQLTSKDDVDSATPGLVKIVGIAVALVVMLIIAQVANRAIAKITKVDEPKG